jgi:prepilin-type N-terminal cleavage/methylation domain-containing protein
MVAKAAREMTKTLARKIKISNLSKSGFTLIEVMVVVGLIGLIMAFAIPNVGSVLKINLSNSTRSIAAAIRTAHDESVLSGKLYRLALDLDKQEYWVEVNDSSKRVLRTEEQEKELIKKGVLKEEDIKKEQSQFVMAKNIHKKKQSLPKGVKIVSIYNAKNKNSISNGTSYIHFFPHGFVEKGIFYFKDSYDREATLMIQSASGKSTIFERKVPVEEL